jgi:hypothetical protein
MKLSPSREGLLGRVFLQADQTDSPIDRVTEDRLHVVEGRLRHVHRMNPGQTRDPGDEVVAPAAEVDRPAAQLVEQPLVEGHGEFLVHGRREIRRRIVSHHDPPAMQHRPMYGILSSLGTRLSSLGSNRPCTSSSDDPVPPTQETDIRPGKQVQEVLHQVGLVVEIHIERPAPEHLARVHRSLQVWMIDVHISGEPGILAKKLLEVLARAEDSLTLPCIEIGDAAIQEPLDRVRAALQGPTGRQRVDLPVHQEDLGSEERGQDRSAVIAAHRQQRPAALCKSLRALLQLLHDHRVRIIEGIVHEHVRPLDRRRRRSGSGRREDFIGYFPIGEGLPPVEQRLFDPRVDPSLQVLQKRCDHSVPFYNSPCGTCKLPISFPRRVTESTRLSR